MLYDISSAPGIRGMVTTFFPINSCTTASARPAQTPREISSTRLGSSRARSNTFDRSGGGNLALYFFSAALNGVQSVSVSFLFLVALIYCLLAFLYAEDSGSRMAGIERVREDNKAKHRHCGRRGTTPKKKGACQIQISRRCALVVCDVCMAACFRCCSPRKAL